MQYKHFFLLALAIAVTTASWSQGFQLGLKGGTNLYKIDGQSFSDEFDYGYAAGIFSHIRFSKKVGIQPEVLWNQQQTRTTNRFRDIYDDGIHELKNVKLNYLTIPLLLTFTPAKFISFQVGPQFGVLINRDETLVANGKNAFKSGDLSALGGVQLNIGGIKLGGRYSLGLNNINNIDSRDVWKNQGFQLYAGIRLL